MITTPTEQVDPTKCPTCGWPIGSEECVGQRRATPPAPAGFNPNENCSPMLSLERIDELASEFVYIRAGNESAQYAELQNFARAVIAADRAASTGGDHEHL